MPDDLMGLPRKARADASVKDLRRASRRAHTVPWPHRSQDHRRASPQAMDLLAALPCRYSPVHRAMDILIIVLVLLLVLGAFGTVPRWPYSSGWGWGPFGLIGVVLLILLVLILTGRLRV